MYLFFRHIAKSADVDCNGNIDYEEYAKYMEELDLKNISQDIKERQEQIKKAKKLKRKDTPVISNKLDQGWIKKFKENTNFNMFSLEATSTKIYFPFQNYQANIEKQFMKLDKKTGKYQVTILNSKKTALLW